MRSLIGQKLLQRRCNLALAKTPSFDCVANLMQVSDHFECTLRSTDKRCNPSLAKKAKLWPAQAKESSQEFESEGNTQKIPLQNPAREPLSILNACVLMYSSNMQNIPLRNQTRIVPNATTNPQMSKCHSSDMENKPPTVNLSPSSWIKQFHKSH